MRSLLQRCALVLGAAVGLLGTRPATANAQKALVYCPVSIDATGCNAIVAALTGPGYPLGVDRGYDGTDGTVDLKTVDLFSYSVFVVPSLADDATTQPYAVLRDPEVVEHLKAALIGRIAMWSGTPDQGATNRAMKDALIQNLAGWAGAAFATAKGPGLVALLDASASAVARYDWVRAVAPLQVTSDPALLIYNSVRALNQRATGILTSGAGAIAYSNMATFGFQVPNGAPGVSLGAVGQTGTSQGGQVVLLTMEAGNAGGATVKTDKDDYPPGMTVVISGSGWDANETVKLTLHHDPLRDSDTELTATADAQGNFVNTEFAPADYDVDVRFVLTAVGQTSGRRAQSTFTDAQPQTVTAVGPTPATVPSGSTGTYAVTVGFNGNASSCTVTLTGTPIGTWPAPAPPGGYFSFLQNPVTGITAATSSLTVTAPTVTSQTTFQFTITATGTCQNQLRSVTSGTINLVVTPTILTPTVSVTGGSSPYDGSPHTASGFAYGNGGVGDVLTPAVTFSYAGTGATVYGPTATPPTNAGTYLVTATFAGNSSYTSASGTASLTITPKVASVTPNAASKVYGDADPALSGTLSGFVAGDGVTAAYSRTGGETVAGGPYTISATLSPSGALDNYAITYNTANFTITPKAASVTPNASSKVYGAADPALTGALNGFLAADGVTATYTRTAGETVAASPYTISATLAPTGVLGNYSITYNTANFAITPKAASVTPDAATKVYGDGDPALSGTLNGFIAGDNVTAAYSRTAGETVASSPYTISATLSPSGVLGNYTITYNTAAFTITPRTASVTPAGASKVYGDADPAFTGTLSGFIAADGVTASYSRTAGETVAASPYTISATLSPSGVLGNYTITYNTANFTITPKTASVSPDPASKVYGSADPSLTGTLSGFLAADGVSALYTRTAGETVNGGPYTISATLSPAGVLGNYNITYNTASFTITAKTASVTPATASKVYGDSDPAFTGTLTGFLAADGVTATYSRTSGETVAGSPYTISATLSPAGVLDNYSITYNTASFTITRRTASVTPNAASKEYGSADPTLTGTLAGFLGSDGVTATYARAAGETVLGGPYPISATLSPTGVLDNYDITYNTAPFTITPKAASVTPNAASKVYGDADPAFTGSLAGFLAGDNVTATYIRNAGETVLGGPYTISATLSPVGVLSNYAITYNTANFTITPKTASVTPDGAGKTYGDADPVLTGTLTGFLAADAVTATYSRTTGETVLGGPYPISATLSPAGVLSNYSITYNTASFTITPKSATVTPAAASKVYGDVDPALTGTLSGFLAADGVTATYSRTAGETVAASPYTISATLSPANVMSNYDITYNTAGFTITPKPASVTPGAESKIYGNSDPTLTGTLSGFLPADNVTAVYARTSGETVAGSPYTISATLSPAGVLGNYAITYNTAAFTITPRPATWNTNPNAKTYGDPDPVPLTTGSAAAGGFLAADGVTATYARTVGEAVTVTPYHITATLSASVAGALNNYTITNAGANFTINPKPLTVTTSASPNAVSYPTSPTLNVSYGMFAFSDTPADIGGPPTLQAINASNAVATPPYPPGSYTVRATGLTSTNYTLSYVEGTFTVSNDKPIVTLVTGPDPISVGGGGTASATVNVTFTDAGANGDLYTISSAWTRSGGGTQTFAGVQTGYTGGLPGTGTATVTATNLVTGVYTVVVTVTDKFNSSSDPYEYRYVVIYDPNGGFVTGGGWINSPEKAYRPDLTLTGKANFGFVSKYQKGQAQPSGDTEFQFHAASLNFKSKNYDWLVINGTTKAQFKGTGTINGAGNYGFLLSALDGDNYGNKKPDTFRIKIWDIATGDIIYDNNFGADELGDPTTQVSGGSIQIKSK